MRVYRGKHRAARSPEREVVGLRPDGHLVVTLGVTLYRMIQGHERYWPAPPGVFIGAPLRDPSTGSPLGEILDYEHPTTSPGRIHPVALCQIRESVRPVFRTFTHAVARDRIIPDAQFRILWRVPTEGRVVTSVSAKSFLAHVDPHIVDAFELEIPFTMLDSANLGAPVVDSADPEALAGMVLEAFRRPDGSTRLTCYPGDLIL